MKQPINKEHKSSKPLILLPIIVLICVVAVIIIFMQAPAASKNEGVTEKTESVTDSSETDLEIETPFCTLNYPIRWNDSVEIITEDLGKEYIVHFYYKHDSEKTEIFQVLFKCGEENESYIGTISQRGIQTNIYLHIVDIEDINLDGNAEINQIRQMQSDSSYLVDALNDDPLFHAKENDNEDIMLPSE